MMSSAWTISRLPSSSTRMYYSTLTRFPRRSNNLINSIHHRSTPLHNNNNNNNAPKHAAALYSPKRRDLHQHIPSIISPPPPPPPILSVTTIPQQKSSHFYLAGSRSIRGRLSTLLYSDQRNHIHSSCHSKHSLVRYPTDSGVSGTSTIISPPQMRTFVSSSIINYSQPYFAMKNSDGVTLRIQLSKSRNFVGIRSTRCQREYNQDRYKIVVLNPPTLSPGLISSASASNDHQIKQSYNSTGQTQMDKDEKTLFYFAIFDGHGGSNTSDFLTANLDGHIDQAKPEMVPDVIKDLRKLGGYFRTFRPHLLEPFLPSDFEEKYGGKRQPQQKRVKIKGKGGSVRPMIFIPHPNATVEDQKEEMEFLKKQGSSSERQGKASRSDSGVSSKAEFEPTEETNKKESEDRKETKIKKERSEKSTLGHEVSNEEEDEDEYDEDEDPFVIGKRRLLNRTSPLPSGTTAYSGSHRSEYDSLVIRERDLIDEEEKESEKAKDEIPTTMTLEQRLCFSFLKCDTELIRDKYRDGSTASAVIVQSKGAFWDTKEDLDLIIAHVGDTRILLCEAPRGECIQLTTDHHPDATVEADRIRKMAAYVTSDSFGENMFLGRVANTRAMGDIAMKPYGVSAEPEIVRRTVKANEAAFLVLVTDGITGVMSNQEIVDCVKLENDPTQAAANVLNLAEQLGAEDNCTVLVVRLPAWGTKMPDLSKELREYRWQSEAQLSRARRR